MIFTHTSVLFLLYQLIKDSPTYNF